MAELIAATGARLFDGEAWCDDSALLFGRRGIAGIVPAGEIPAGVERVAFAGGTIAPALIDLQVNGGGGVLFNDAPELGAIATICAAHARFGTGGVLVTLMSDIEAAMDRAVTAGIAARQAGVPGFLGLHFEGPHIAPSRRGAHDPARLRPMQDADVARLVAARRRLPAVLTTLAPEMVTPAQVSALVAGGVVVSLGHSETGLESAEALVAAGATLVTHLFNAMSPLGHRAPGLAGLALADGRVSASLIADGIHVAPAMLGIAIRAKAGPGHMLLVSDAMSPLGTTADAFALGDRRVERREGALRLANGTLAGADIALADAVRLIHSAIGLPLEDALRMASLYPAQVMGLERHGRLAPGSAASFVHLDDELNVLATWIDGRQVWTRDER